MNNREHKQFNRTFDAFIREQAERFHVPEGVIIDCIYRFLNIRDKIKEELMKSQLPPNLFGGLRAQEPQRKS